MFHTNEIRFVQACESVTFENLEITPHLSVLKKTKLLMIRNSKHFIGQASAKDTTYEPIHQIQEKGQYTEDEMISNRAYKKSITVQSTLDDLKKHSGSWYDESVVAFFAEILSYAEYESI